MHMRLVESSEPGEVEWNADEGAYTRSYVDALQYAAVRHRNQTREGGRLPYLTHLMAVSTLVWAHGGDEEQAIAGLLHDTVEDCGGAPVLDEVRGVFGDRAPAGTTGGCATP